MLLLAETTATMPTVLAHARRVLAQGFGVPGARATTCEEFALALERAIASGGPYLIEAVVA